MLVRNAVLEDIEQIMEVYRASKEYMVASGNPNQWVNGYPTREMINKDINRGQFFVCEENGHVITKRQYRFYQSMYFSCCSF